MKLDTAKMQRMLDEECQKLVVAGRCFGCKKTGHLYRNCPERPKCKGKDKQKVPKVRLKPRVRTADTSALIKEASSEEEEEEETGKETDAPPAYSKKNLMAAIKKLSMADHDNLLDTVALNFDQDF